MLPSLPSHWDSNGHQLKKLLGIEWSVCQPTFLTGMMVWVIFFLKKILGTALNVQICTEKLHLPTSTPHGGGGQFTKKKKKKNIAEQIWTFHSIPLNFFGQIDPNLYEG